MRGALLRAVRIGSRRPWAGTAALTEPLATCARVATGSRRRRLLDGLARPGMPPMRSRRRRRGHGRPCGRRPQPDRRPGPRLRRLVRPRRGRRHRQSAGECIPQFPASRRHPRVRAVSARGRSSPGTAASKMSRTCSAQSAAQSATRRRSASLSVWGDVTTASYRPAVRGTSPGSPAMTPSRGRDPQARSRWAPLGR